LLILKEILILEELKRIQKYDSKFATLLSRAPASIFENGRSYYLVKILVLTLADDILFLGH